MSFRSLRACHSEPFALVIPNPSRLSFRAKRGICLSLRVNSARNVLLLAAPKHRADSSVRQTTPDLGMTSFCFLEQSAKKRGPARVPDGPSYYKQLWLEQG